MFWQLLYNALVVPLLFIGFHVSGVFNPKVKAAVAGRKQVFRDLVEQLQRARDLEKTTWFHFTSVGEFEQAKPLIEAIYAETRVVLTFFSPSVAPDVEAYRYADATVYLPLDTPRNVERMLQLIRPTLLVFSKFDIWPNLVWRSAKRGVPTVVIAGTLHAESRRLSPFMKPFFRSVHRQIGVHCAISADDAARFADLCSPDNQIVVTGDTRYEQVYRRAESVQQGDQFFHGQGTMARPILIAGSTYTEDERVLFAAYQFVQERMPYDYPHLILVPHEPTPERIREIRDVLSRLRIVHRCLSELEPDADLAEVDILIVDSVGLLARLYSVADIAFVGGSFRGSVHNVIEPAVVSKPVLLGPTIQNSYEARVLVGRGGAAMIHTPQEFADKLAVWLTDADARTIAGSIGEQLVQENLGAVERTLTHLRAYL